MQSAAHKSIWKDTFKCIYASNELFAGFLRLDMQKPRRSHFEKPFHD